MSDYINKMSPSENAKFNEDVIKDVMTELLKAGYDRSMLQTLEQNWRSKVSSIPEISTEKTEVTGESTTKVNNSLAIAALTAPVPQVIKWVWQDKKLPTILRSLLAPEGHFNSLFGAIQLDGVVPPIKEQSSDEDKDLEAKSEHTSEAESLNSGDDPVGDDDHDGDPFDCDNVIACQYKNICRTKNVWTLELCNGVMYIDGKDYVFKNLIGKAEF